MQNQHVGSGFLFVGGHTGLDFLNTKPVQKGEAQELLTDFGALLRWFGAAGFLGEAGTARLASQWENSPEAAAALERILSFREHLRSGIIALESDGKVPKTAIEEVNALLKRHPVTLQLERVPGGFAQKVQFSPVTPEDLLGILANVAADLFTHRDLRRIRKCGYCALHFYDRTKSNTRRWCSMGVCGNRVKVASYTARHRRPG